MTPSSVVSWLEVGQVEQRSKASMERDGKNLLKGQVGIRRRRREERDELEMDPLSTGYCPLSIMIHAGWWM